MIDFSDVVLFIVFVMALFLAGVLLALQHLRHEVETLKKQTEPTPTVGERGGPQKPVTERSIVGDVAQASQYSADVAPVVGANGRLEVPEVVTKPKRVRKPRKPRMDLAEVAHQVEHLAHLDRETRLAASVATEAVQ